MESYREPPQIDPEKLDFSEFHPLDHSLFQCDDKKKHWKLVWEFKWSGEIKRWTLCKIGIHNVGTVFKFKDGKPYKVWRSCIHCGKRKSNPQFV